MSKELTRLRQQLGNPQYPKPRYSVAECLLLLGEGRKRFYSKVKAGQYHLTKDGRRSYMLHEDLMRAAEGDRQTESTVASHAPAVDSQAA